MKSVARQALAVGLALAVMAPLVAAEIKVDLKKEQVGKPPKTFEPMVGTWVVAEDGRREGRSWSTAGRGSPARTTRRSS